MRRRRKTKLFVSIRQVAVTASVLVVGAGGGVWLVMKELYPYALIAVVAVIWAMARLFRIYTKSVRKATFMFDAIDNDDFAFAFTDNPAIVDDAELNQALNRIKAILSNAKTEVIERERYYELIMQHVKTGIITINSRGNIHQVNGEAMRIFGLPVFTHINQLKIIDPAIAAAMFAVQAGEKAQLAFSNERGEVSISLVASEVTVRGETLKIIAVTDINNELAEKELESWMRLIRVLTHEIMNSLAPITSLSDTLIDMSGDNDPDMVRGLQTINATGKSLISFVESYRKFTYIPTPDKKLFEVKPFLERAVALQTQGTEVRIECSVEPEDMLVYADEDLAGQVILNVLKNAVQAVSGKADAWINVESYIDEHENIIIEVSNNGGAIPAEIAENIFMPFYTTKEGGSGIGLSISRQIMRLHGGSVRLTSNTDEKVTFTLLFG